MPTKTSPAPKSVATTAQQNLLDMVAIPAALFVDGCLASYNNAFNNTFSATERQRLSQHPRITQVITEVSIVLETIAFDLPDSSFQRTFHCQATPIVGAANTIALFFEDISLEVRGEKANALLYRLSLVLSATDQPLKTKLQLAVDQILFEADIFDCSVILFDKATGKLQPYVWGTTDLSSDMAGESCFALGEGIAGAVGLTLQPIVVPNILTDDRFTTKPTSPGARSLLSVPITQADELFGVMNITREKQQNFSDKDVQLFTMIASRLAALIQTDHSQQIERQQTRLIQLVSAAKGTIKDYKQITSLIGELLATNSCYIVHWNLRDETQWFKRPEIQRAFEAKTLASLKQLILDANGREQLITQLWTRLDDAIIYPLVINRQLGGFIYLKNTNWLRQYTQAELNLGASIAGQLAISLENVLFHEEVEDERKKLSQIQNTLPDGLILYSRDMRVVMHNTAAKRMLGIKKDITNRPWSEVLGEKVGEYCAHPLNRHFDPQEFLRAAIEEGKTSTGLATLEGRTPRTIEVDVAPVYDRRDELSGILAHFRDITQIHELQQKMAARVEQLTNLFKISSVTGFNVQQIVRRVLRLVLELLAVKGAQLLLVEPETGQLQSLECVGNIDLINRLQTKITLKANWVIRHNQPRALKIRLSKNEEPVHLLIAPIQGHHQVCVGVMLVIDKVDNRHFSREDINLLSIVSTQIASKLDTAWLLNQIETDRNKLAAIIEQSVDGILVLDTALQIQLWNPALEQMTGIKSDDVLHSSINEVQGRIEILQRVESDKLTELSIRNVLTQAQMWLGIAYAPIINDQETTGYVAIIRDISRQKELEKSKNEFVSTASHELRSPITAIVGYLSMLKRGDAGQIVNQQQAFFVDKAYQNAKRMVGLIEDLLTTTRMETGQVRYQIEPIKIGEVIDTILADLCFKAEERSITLEVNREHQATVLADRDGLQQAMVNIVTNAIKYTPNKGKVTISFKPAEEKGKPFLTIYTQDTGVGIDPTDQDKVFEKFSRVDNPLSVSAGGTGLGLYITKSIIEEMGGKIWVKSKKNDGSIFCISLPLARRPSKER